MDLRWSISFRAVVLIAIHCRINLVKGQSGFETTIFETTTESETSFTAELGSGITTDATTRNLTTTQAIANTTAGASSRNETTIFEVTTLPQTRFPGIQTTTYEISTVIDTTDVSETAKFEVTTLPDTPTPNVNTTTKFEPRTSPYTTDYELATTTAEQPTTSTSPEITSTVSTPMTTDSGSGFDPTTHITTDATTTEVTTEETTAEITTDATTTEVTTDVFTTEVTTETTTTEVTTDVFTTEVTIETTTTELTTIETTTEVTTTTTEPNSESATTTEQTTTSTSPETTSTASTPETTDLGSGFDPTTHITTDATTTEVTTTDETTTKEPTDTTPVTTDETTTAVTTDATTTEVTTEATTDATTAEVTTTTVTTDATTTEVTTDVTTEATTDATTAEVTTTTVTTDATTTEVTTDVTTEATTDATTKEDPTTTTEPRCECGDGEACTDGSPTDCACGYCTKVCPVCPTNAICRSADTGCECIEGFTGDPSEECSDIDECNDEELGCPGKKECVNTEGSYQCECLEGYFSSGDECVMSKCDSNQCAAHAACKDDSNVCECVDGWTGSADSCENVDECQTGDNDCQDDPTLLCMDTIGSYYCTCISGYRSTDEGCEPVSCQSDEVPCPSSLSDSNCKNATFPSTQAGYSAISVNVCPETTANKGKPLATRTCSVTGSWGAPTWLSSCNEGIENLTSASLETDEDRETVAGSLAVLTSQPEELQPEDVEQSTEVMKNVLEAENITTSVADSLVSTIGSLAEAPTLGQSNSSEDLFTLLNDISTKISLSGNETYKAVSNNISLIVTQDSPISRTGRTGIGIIVLVRPNTTTLGFRDDQILFVSQDLTAGTSYLGNAIQANIFVPSNVVTGPSGQRTYFTTFGNTNVFVRSNSTEQDDESDLLSNDAEVESLVLSATVDGRNISGLLTSERIEFTSLREENSTDDKRDVCAFWSDRYLQWSESGCEIDNKTNDKIVACKCDHLTSFATLLDTASISPRSEAALETITIVGCSISTFALLLMILVFVFVENTRKGKRFRAAYLLVSLSIALMGLNICLIISNTRVVDPAVNGDTPCVAIAIVMHFFLISACAWMNCEAVNLYLVIMKPIFAKNELRNSMVILCTCLWGWIVPIIYILSTSIPHPDWYTREEDHQCWIKPDMVVYLVAIPLAIEVTFNIVIYVILTVKMCSTNHALRGQRWANSRSTKWGKFAVNICIFTTVGVTWVFGLLLSASSSNPDVAEVFAYIFTILNSFQGAILFVLYIVRSRAIRRSLLTEFTRISTSLGLSKSSDWTSDTDVSQRKKRRTEEARGRSDFTLPRARTIDRI